jgi:S1-C subfamily serine protease
VILAVNGEAVRTVGGLQRKIRSYDPGETVDVAVVRRSDQTRDNVQVTLVAAPSPETAAEPRTASTARRDRLGVEVEPISDDFRAEYELSDDVTGVVITDSEQRGALGRKVQMRVPLNGRIVQYPWVIQDVNGESVGSVSDYERVVAELDEGSVASISVYDPVSGNSLFPSIRIPSR